MHNGQVLSACLSPYFISEFNEFQWNVVLKSALKVTGRIKLIFFKWHVEESSGNLHNIDQRGQTGGPWATSGPSPLVTRPAELFVPSYKLICFLNSEGFEKNRDSYFVCCFTYNDIAFKTLS
jgi:hypothetical protein